MSTDWIQIAESGPAVTESNVVRFEIGVVNRRLPDDYRRFLLKVNGGRPRRSHCVFTKRQDEREGEAALGRLYSINAPDDRNDLAKAQVQLDPLLRQPKGFMRIGCDVYGHPIIMPLVSEHSGEIWYFDFAEGIEDRSWIGWFERRDVWYVAKSFTEFMAGLRPEDEDNGAGVSRA